MGNHRVRSQDSVSVVFVRHPFARLAHAYQKHIVDFDREGWRDRISTSNSISSSNNEARSSSSNNNSISIYNLTASASEPTLPTFTEFIDQFLENRYYTK